MKMPSMIVDNKPSGANWQSSWLECRYSVKQDDKSVGSSQVSSKILNEIKNSCNSGNRDVQKEALKCWELWINNQDVDSWKQNKICYTAVQPLITKKFQLYHKDKELCLIRLKLFWDLISKVQSFIPQFEGPQYILEAFVQSCVTWLSCAKEIDETVQYAIIQYLCRLLLDESEEVKSCGGLCSRSKVKCSLSKNLFNRLVGKFLNVFLAWDYLKDKEDLIRLWTGILKFCERYYESIPITLWHNIFKLARRISSEPKEDLKIRITFLHRCATVLKSVLNSSKHLDANFVDTMPSEALLAMLIEVCYTKEENCDFETFLLCQEICQVFGSNIISHRGYKACMPILMKIDDIPSRTLLWGLWGGIMKSFEGSVKSLNVDSFDRMEMKFYRKLRGVAVNFSLDEKFLDEKCIASIKVMVDDVLQTSQEFTRPHDQELVESISDSKNYVIVRKNNLRKELLGNNGIFSSILMRWKLFLTDGNGSNGILLRTKAFKKLNFVVNSYLEDYLDMMKSINRNSYSLQIFVNFKDLELAAMLMREAIAISILKIEGLPVRNKELKKINGVEINSTENKLVEITEEITETDNANSLGEDYTKSDLTGETDNKENLKSIEDDPSSLVEKKSAAKRRKSCEVLADSDFKRRRSNRISSKPKVACCGDESCSGNLIKIGEKRKRNDPTDCCNKKAKISKCDIEKNKSMKSKSPPSKTFPKIEDSSKNRRRSRRSEPPTPTPLEEENCSQKSNEEVVKESEKIVSSKTKNAKKNSSRKENKKPKNKMITKSIKSYFSKINDESVAVDTVAENVSNDEVLPTSVPEDREEILESPNDSPNESVVSSIELIEKCLLENFENMESSPDAESDLTKLDSSINDLDNFPSEEIVANTEEVITETMKESMPVEIYEENIDTKSNVKIENDLSAQEEKPDLNNLQSFEVSRIVKVESELDLGCESLKCDETLEDQELLKENNLPNDVIKPDPEMNEQDKTDSEAPKNLEETPERKMNGESSRNETPKGNRNVPQSRAFRMLALIQDPLVPNNVNYSEKTVSEHKVSCKKFPKAEKNSRASRMLALLPEHEIMPSGAEPEVKIIEPTRKPFNDQNFISRPEVNGVASLKKEPGASVLKSPNMATPPRKKSIRFDDDRNETMVYYTDSPPLKSLQRVSFRRVETENSTEPS